MRYFGYIAEQAFKTAPDGRRLFYRGGPWSRPYVVPDADTEQRLFKKQLWMMRVLLGGMIIGQPFIFLVVPDVTSKPLWFFGYMAIVLIVFWVVGSIVFRAELAKLSRVESGVPLHDFYSGMAAQHTTGKLLLLILGAVAFVAGGYWMVASGRNAFVGWLSIVFFGLCGVAGVYALSLKAKQQ
jgi:hypothetical protein